MTPTTWTVGLIGLLLSLGYAQAAEGQVGLTSGMAQVTLVARIAPQGSIHTAGPARETGRAGMVREASAIVRLSANTGYRLVVRGMGSPNSRIWVRDANGEFQELTAGSSVTVAQTARAAGQWEREVRYRVERPESSQPLAPLPVRYEMAINPTM